MDSGIGPLTPEALLEHDSFVRAVARGLLADAEASADVAQETWMRALAGGPRERGALRGWLGRVAGNLARDRRRSATRRALREERAARGEAEESVAVAFERLSLQRDVVGAILALDEPYRGVILLRYFHDLEPQVIAERLGRKPATVRTQLVRAHELLRARLDSRYGRETWAAALLPAAFAEKGAVVAGAALVVLGLAGAAALWQATRGPARATGAPPVARTDAAAQGPEASARAPAVAGTRERAEERAAEPIVAAAAPEAPVELESLAPRAELYASGRYDDDELASFSFEFGRDDVAGTDRNIRYTGRTLEARFVVGDLGVLVDLGELPVRDLWAWRGLLGAPIERPTVQRGHTYFLWSRDGDTDLAAAFEVLELVPEDRCVLEWYATSDGTSARASFRDESPGARLARRLTELRAELRRPRELDAPRVWLQGRGGDGHGNEYRVDMAGGMTHIYELSPDPLDLHAPIDSRQAAFCAGGFVPEGQAFVVTRATYWGAAIEDPNHPCAFALVIGGERVVERERAERFSGTWDGRIEVPPGEETLTYLELCNASAGEVKLFGELVARPGLGVRARPSEPRRPREPGPAPTPLREPRVRLQGRKGHCSPNELCVRLDGSLSFLGTCSEAPLDLDAPIDPFEPGVAYCDGGTVPPGCVFVVTQVDYQGFASSEGTGRVGFTVMVGGERIVEHKFEDEIAGTWHGRIEIPAGAEKLTRLEIRNSSAGEAILYGEFVRSR